MIGHVLLGCTVLRFYAGFINPEGLPYSGWSLQLACLATDSSHNIAAALQKSMLGGGSLVQSPSLHLSLSLEAIYYSLEIDVHTMT